MPTDFPRIKRLNRVAVSHSVELVGTVTADDLRLATPCDGWTLADLLTHMTAQHQGFAAAATGAGADLANWSVPALGDDAVERYTAAAGHLLEAFAAVEAPDQPFALPEFTSEFTFPAARAIGFHLIDYLLHSWDVAMALGVSFDPDPELVDAALPIARAIPDGANRLEEGSAFRPSLPVADDVGTLDRILALTGRSAQWSRPEHA